MKKLRLVTPDIQMTASGPRILDPVRKQLVPDGPEELVRQSVLRSLVQDYGYPISALASEELVARGTNNRDRADVLVRLPARATASPFRIAPSAVVSREPAYSAKLASLQAAGFFQSGVHPITVADELDVVVDGTNVRCRVLGFTVSEGVGHVLALKPVSPCPDSLGVPPVLGLLLTGYGRTEEERQLAKELRIRECEWNYDDSLQLAQAISIDGDVEERLAAELSTLSPDGRSGALLLYGSETDSFGVLVEIDLEAMDDQPSAAAFDGVDALAADSESPMVSGALVTVAVIECKAPSVLLSVEVVEQANRYAATLSARFVVVTNGRASRVFQRADDGATTEVEDLPTYDATLADATRVVVAVAPDAPASLLHESAKSGTDALRFHRRHRGETAGHAIPSDMLLPILALDDALRGSPKIAGLPFDRHGVRFLEDLGINLRNPGSAVGAGWPGLYRDLLIEAGDARLVLGLSIQGGWDQVDRARLSRRARHGNGSTYLLVSTADGQEYETTLQCCLDKSLRRQPNGWTLRHDGSLTAGKGSVRRAVLFEALQARLPVLMGDACVHLGELPHHARIDVETVKDLLARVAVYALVRRMVKQGVKAERRRATRRKTR